MGRFADLDTDLCHYVKLRFLKGMVRQGGFTAIRIDEWHKNDPLEGRNNRTDQRRLDAEAKLWHKELGASEKECEPRDDYPLEGMVVGLESESVNAPRIVTVRAKISRQWHKVRVQLSEEDYRTAMSPHENWYVVQTEGELRRDGRQYTLANPRNFRLYSEEPPLPLNAFADSEI